MAGEPDMYQPPVVEIVVVLTFGFAHRPLDGRREVLGALPWLSKRQILAGQYREILMGARMGCAVPSLHICINTGRSFAG